MQRTDIMRYGHTLRSLELKNVEHAQVDGVASSEPTRGELSPRASHPPPPIGAVTIYQFRRPSAHGLRRTPFRIQPWQPANRPAPLSRVPQRRPKGCACGSFGKTTGGQQKPSAMPWTPNDGRRRALRGPRRSEELPVGRARGRASTSQSREAGGEGTFSVR